MVDFQGSISQFLLEIIIGLIMNIVGYQLWYISVIVFTSYQILLIFLLYKMVVALLDFVAASLCCVVFHQCDSAIIRSASDSRSAEQDDEWGSRSSLYALVGSHFYFYWHFSPFFFLLCQPESDADPFFFLCSGCTFPGFGECQTAFDSAELHLARPMGTAPALPDDHPSRRDLPATPWKAQSRLMFNVSIRYLYCRSFYCRCARPLSPRVSLERRRPARTDSTCLFHQLSSNALFIVAEWLLRWSNSICWCIVAGMMNQSQWLYNKPIEIFQFFSNWFVSNCSPYEEYWLGCSLALIRRWFNYLSCKESAKLGQLLLRKLLS